MRVASGCEGRPHVCPTGPLYQPGLACAGLYPQPGIGKPALGCGLRLRPNARPGLPGQQWPALVHPEPGGPNPLRADLGTERKRLDLLATEVNAALRWHIIHTAGASLATP